MTDSAEIYEKLKNKFGCGGWKIAKKIENQKLNRKNSKLFFKKMNLKTKKQNLKKIREKKRFKKIEKKIRKKIEKNRKTINFFKNIFVSTGTPWCRVK